MRPILFAAALVLCASSANAQTMWQMNAAYQNQYNSAFQSAAMPYYYAPAYRPIYRPAFRGSYGLPDYGTPRDIYRQQMISEQQRQTRALRSIDNALRNMEIDAMFNR